MQTHDHSTHETSNEAIGNKTRWRANWIFGGFAAIMLALLAVEHRAHVLGWLPWIFLLACPLMHLFMHGGHGGHGGHGDDSQSGKDK
ncbi:MAG: DUF2933 domain-containing protein [Rhodocyclaceae bacterium]|nr:DUF2933 domain-containing protein [Rhodocyclaceae bacterium]